MTQYSCHSFVYEAVTNVLFSNGDLPSAGLSLSVPRAVVLSINQPL